MGYAFEEASRNREASRNSIHERLTRYAMVQIWMNSQQTVELTNIRRAHAVCADLTAILQYATPGYRRTVGGADTSASTDRGLSKLLLRCCQETNKTVKIYCFPGPL